MTPSARKAQGLLALLGVASDLRRTRNALQDKLWSDRSPEQGSASLRQELANLRRSLGDASDVLLSKGGWIGLDPQRVRVSLHPEDSDWELTGEPPEFAEGLDIADPEWENWIRDQRTRTAERLSIRPAPAPAAAVVASLLQAASPPPPRLILTEPSGLRSSIAAMPLSFVGERAEASYIADGLAIDLIGRLARFRRIDVIAYASTRALEPLGLGPREVGLKLGVRYVTQGLLWLGRTRMRVSFSLIDSTTETVLWNKNFDRPREDFFEIQDEITTEIAAAIMLEVDQHERARVRARDPNSLDTYELCLRGLDEMARLDHASCDSALDLFRRAEERERGYARALSGISRAHGFYWKYRWTDRREEALEQADRYAVLAVDSDVNDAGASAALGWVALYSRNHDRSLAAYERAMDLNPSDADILAEYADVLSHCGSNHQAIDLFKRAIRLNPHMADSYRKDLAGAYFNVEDYDAAIQTIQSMLRSQTSAQLLAAAYALTGRHDEARRAAATVRKVYPEFSAAAWVTMIPDRNEEDTARFLEGMQRAGL